MYTRLVAWERRTNLSWEDPSPGRRCNLLCELWLTFVVPQGFGQHMERSEPRPGWSATQLGANKFGTFTLEAIEPPRV